MSNTVEFGQRRGNDVEWDNDARRVCGLQATIDRVLAKSDVLGITRIGETTHLDVLAIPNYSVIAPGLNYPARDGVISVFSGKGPTRKRALASALMETAERYSCIGRQEHAVAGSVNGLAERWALAPPGAFVAPQSHLVTDDDVIEWVPSRDLVTGASVLVPAQLVYTPYFAPAGMAQRASSTNGVASGNTVEEATLHALYEVIERDAEALMWAGGRSVTLDLDTVDHPDAKDLIERYREAGLRLQVRDITQDIGVPTFIAICIDVGLAQTNFVNGGKGTHLDPGIALVRSLTEVAQSRVIEMGGVREDMSPRVSLTEANFGDFLEQNEAWYADTEHKISWSEFSNRASPNVIDDLHTVLGEIVAVAIDHCYMVDLTRPELDIPVVRVMVPGLEHHLAGSAMGPRALAVTGEDS